jgi:hypothetical protein
MKEAAVWRTTRVWLEARIVMPQGAGPLPRSPETAPGIRRGCGVRPGEAAAPDAATCGTGDPPLEPGDVRQDAHSWVGGVCFVFVEGPSPAPGRVGPALGAALGPAVRRSAITVVVPCSRAARVVQDLCSGAAAAVGHAATVRGARKHIPGLRCRTRHPRAIAGGQGWAACTSGNVRDVQVGQN